MTTLTLEGVEKSVGGRRILRNISTTFNEGGINLLLGPNGSGKTSLLRVCALLDSPGAGRVILGPSGRGRHTPAGAGVTMVFQQPVLFNRSVRDNLTYPLELRGTGVTETAELVAEAMAAAGLGGLGGRNALRLSGGEAQRLALARAYVIRPSVLLLDEPVANLDPLSRWRIEEMVLEMRERFGTTIILTTHDLLQARKIGEAVFFIERGRLSEPVNTREFFHDPPSEAAARYIAGVLHQEPEWM